MKNILFTANLEPRSQQPHALHSDMPAAWGRSKLRASGFQEFHKALTVSFANLISASCEISRERICIH